MRRFLRWAAIALGALFLIASAVALWSYSRFRGSLPRMSGEARIEGLDSPVTVAFDDHGVPTVHAGTRLDLARATGYLHAQNRFFAMDLSRRSAAGELAELFGSAVLARDRETRVHRFRHVAREIMAALDPSDRALQEAYAAGVNSGLKDLGAPPIEHLLLPLTPKPWLPEDNMLVLLSMYLELQDEDASSESALGLMRDLLPAPVFSFLAQAGTEWDAPIVGEPLPPVPVPGPEVFDLRAEGSAASGGGKAGMSPHTEFDDSERTAGSNNWAVSGRLTSDGGALLAGDMHLGLTVPNIWYRISMIHEDPGTGIEQRVTGVTLPGAPAMVVGSNGHVAWAFTNSYADWVDLVILESDPSDPEAYRTRDGMRRLEHHQEVIHVRGEASVTLDVATSIWGPVIDSDHRGRRRALRWVAHDPGASNGLLSRMEAASSLEEALSIAAASGIPGQNLMLADSAGRIAWTLIGKIPRRFGLENDSLGPVMAARLPASWADGQRGWDGWLTPEEYPRVVDPSSGRLWTANARVVGDPMLQAIGDGGYDLGARASQIRDGLLALEKAGVPDMLHIQLDDRALFLSRWRDLLLASLTPEAVAADARRAEARRYVEDWGGRAAVDSVGYRIVRGFRRSLAAQTLGALTRRCREADKRFDARAIAQDEGPLWALVSQRPLHLLDPKHADWDAQILAALDETLGSLVKDGFTLGQRTWGQRNTVQVRHPISFAAPFLSSWLDMPPIPLPGDTDMPRVQGVGFGASQRMVVSPGREELGIFHMPCGQSGHPLSPHYRDGHDAWARGEPTPFLPGPPVTTLTLRPGVGS